MFNQMNLWGKMRIPFLFIIDFDMKVPVAFPLSKCPDDVFYNFRGLANDRITETLAKPIQFDIHPPEYSHYLYAFKQVIDQLKAGNTYLLNLTFPSRIDTNLSLREIYMQSEAAYKLYYRDHFVVFSPERFVSIKDGTIVTCPMKGTIDANQPNAEQTLINDPKEYAEHTTIVDLMRNDLNQVAHDVRVIKFRYIDTITTHGKTLLQVSSRIEGRLPANYMEHLGDILQTLLPAGSISGAPKPRTVRIIKSVETYTRGYYTGVMGLFDGKILDSAVMIRFIENTHEGLMYKSGGGVTSDSQPQTEYRELIDKIYVPIR